jgi:CyaY protein
MNEAEFNDRVDEDLNRIEEALDDCEADIDAELHGSVLTLNCENGSAVIFSRQTASRELWMAARSGGFHFRLEDDRWCCTRSGRPLREMFAEVMREQAGEAVDVDI